VSYEDQIAIAILTVRLFVGILFFFQGYDKIFRVGVTSIIFLMMIPSSMDIYSLDYFINQYISP